MRYYEKRKMWKNEEEMEKRRARRNVGKERKSLGGGVSRDDESSRQGENRLKSQVVSVKSGKRKTKREGEKERKR